jgi:DNA polymerase-3 subunit delta
MPTIQQTEKAWKAGKPDAIYLFYGEEEFLRADMLGRALDAFIPDISLRSFNYDQLSGNDHKITDVINCAKNYPVMAEMRVVICREAEKIFAVRKGEKVGPKDEGKFDVLYNYLEDPNRNTLLIFDLDKPGNKTHYPWKSLFTKMTPVEFPALKEPAAIEWITQRATKSGRTLETKAGQALVAHLGTDLRTLASELEKLISYVGESTLIKASDVEGVVGFSPSDNVFELTKVIGSGSKARAAEMALRILAADKSARYPMFAILSKYLEQLIITRDMSDRRESDNAIAQALGLYGGGAYYVKDYVTAARRYASPKKLDDALKALVRAEFDTRRAKIDDSLLVERLIAEITP